MSAPKRYKFESRTYAPPPDGGNSDGDFEADSDEENIIGANASARFRDILVELKLAGKLSAKHCCLLSYWAEKGGMAPPPDGSLAKSPKSKKPKDQTGAFSKKFDKVLGMTAKMKDKWYVVRAPCYVRTGLGRSCIDIEVEVP